MTNQLRYLQINLAHSRASSANVINMCMQFSPDIVFVQEPYVHSNRIMGFELTDLVICADVDPKCAIVFPNFSQLSAEVFCCHKSSDLIVVQCTFPSVSLTLINCYVAPSSSFSRFLMKLESFVVHPLEERLLLVGDFNASHPAWGGNVLNDGGELLMEFFVAHHLQFLNNPFSTATFETINGSSWIDLTVTNSALFPFCSDWQVVLEESLSDHRYIFGRLFSR